MFKIKFFILSISLFAIILLIIYLSDISKNNSNNTNKPIVVKELEKNALWYLLEDIKSNTDINFTKTLESYFDWKYKTNKIELLGYNIGASNLSDDEQNKVKAFFIDNEWLVDEFNTKVATLVTTNAYKKDGLVCLFWQEFKQASYNIKINCAFLEDKILETVDSYGCLSDAGYVWCALKQKCVAENSKKCVASAPPKVIIKQNPIQGNRIINISPQEQQSLEEFQTSQRAAQIALDYVKKTEHYTNNGFNLDTINVNSEDCNGCWIIDLSYEIIPDSDDINPIVEMLITLENWQVIIP